MCLQGGIKTVVWTDTVQAIIMLLGMLVLCFVGTARVGGMHALVDGAWSNGRFNLNKCVASGSTFIEKSIDIQL